MFYMVTDWLKAHASLVLSLCALLIALRAEFRAGKNESIRSRQSIIGDIRSWANVGIALLADLSDEIEKNSIGSADTLRRLFALTDQGRLFFENANKGLYGTHKAPANQGKRPRILSWLVFAYKLGSTQGGYDAEEQVQILTEIQKHFVSDCQSLMRPSKLGSMTMKDLDRQFQDKNLMDWTDMHPVIIKARDFVTRDHERFRGMIL